MPSAPKREWPTTQPGLLGRLQLNDPQAWFDFVAIYMPLVYDYCVKQGLQHADALTVTNSSLLKVRNFEYDPEKGKFRNWLITVIHHEIARLVRCERRAAERGDGKADSEDGFDLIDHVSISVDPESLDYFQEAIYQAAVQRVRPEFADDEWRAYEATMRQVPPLTTHEVAAELGRSKGWVSKVRTRIMNRLGAEMIYLAEDLPKFD